VQCTPDEAVNAVERGVCVDARLLEATTGEVWSFFKGRSGPTSPMRGKNGCFFSIVRNSRLKPAFRPP
jgi:hypothetical protein